ncbi:hypothetical protein P154DRAFT_619774 [Amniculicola lignicola CBS 123094]|uniref:Uncharacterized protein n=1 Tax=Amniculicola lignicola CBS 123094 TaxID=1392246 RepID=A0A6A5WL26_9PLEO|nr:hypothetical protein P154DRAFT_619774 [Amniculicola lignicola CBS 123094]
MLTVEDPAAEHPGERKSMTGGWETAKRLKSSYLESVEKKKRDLKEREEELEEELEEMKAKMEEMEAEIEKLMREKEEMKELEQVKEEKDQRKAKTFGEREYQKACRNALRGKKCDCNPPHDPKAVGAFKKQHKESKRSEQTMGRCCDRGDVGSKGEIWIMSGIAGLPHFIATIQHPNWQHHLCDACL